MVARSQSTMHNGAEGGGGVGHSTVAGGGRRTGRPWARTGLELAGDTGTKTGQSGPFPGMYLSREKQIAARRSRQGGARRREEGELEPDEVSVQVIRPTRVPTGTAGRRLAEFLSAAEEGIGQGEEGGRRGASSSSAVSGCDPEPRCGGMWATKAWATIHLLGGLGTGRAKLRDW